MRYNALQLMAGSELGLGSHVHGIHIHESSGTVQDCHPVQYNNRWLCYNFKRHAAVDQVTPHALSPTWERDYASWLHGIASTIEAHDLVCQLYPPDAVIGSPSTQNTTRLRQPCSAMLNTAISRDQSRGERQGSLDQSADIASRKCFPPSAARVAIRHASRASRPGLAVGIIRVM